MIELKVYWSGWSGGPGYSTFHGLGTTGDAAQGLAGAIDTFFSESANLIPSSITVQVQPTFRVLDEATGALTFEGTLTSPPGPHVGTGNAAFANVAGMCVNWLTNASAGRKIRVGRTFMVPLTAFIWGTDGTVNDSVVAQLQASASKVITSAAGLAVWKRPKNGAGGEASVAVQARVPDEAVILRSRRR